MAGGLETLDDASREAVADTWQPLMAFGATGELSAAFGELYRAMAALDEHHGDLRGELAHGTFDFRHAARFHLDNVARVSEWLGVPNDLSEHPVREGITELAQLQVRRFGVAPAISTLGAANILLLTARRRLDRADLHRRIAMLDDLAHRIAPAEPTELSAAGTQPFSATVGPARETMGSTLAAVQRRVDSSTRDFFDTFVRHAEEGYGHLRAGELERRQKLLTEFLSSTASDDTAAKVIGTLHARLADSSDPRQTIHAALSFADAVLSPSICAAGLPQLRETLDALEKRTRVTRWPRQLVAPLSVDRAVPLAHLAVAFAEAAAHSTHGSVPQNPELGGALTNLVEELSYARLAVTAPRAAITPPASDGSPPR